MTRPVGVDLFVVLVLCSSAYLVFESNLHSLTNAAKIKLIASDIIGHYSVLLLTFWPRTHYQVGLRVDLLNVCWTVPEWSHIPPRHICCEPLTDVHALTGATGGHLLWAQCWYSRAVHAKSHVHLDRLRKIFNKLSLERCLTFTPALTRGQFQAVNDVQRKGIRNGRFVILTYSNSKESIILEWYLMNDFLRIGFSLAESNRVNLFRVHERNTLFKARKRILPVTIVTGFLVGPLIVH